MTRPDTLLLTHFACDPQRGPNADSHRSADGRAHSSRHIDAALALTPPASGIPHAAGVARTGSRQGSDAVVRGPASLFDTAHEEVIAAAVDAEAEADARLLQQLLIRDAERRDRKSVV